MKRRLLSALIFCMVAVQLFLLGKERGFALVGRSTAGVTSLALAAWLTHMVLHELSHLVAARLCGFTVRGLRLGPLQLDFTKRPVRVRWALKLSGGVNALPRGQQRLKARLRAVAAAGPLMTVVVTSALAAVWHARQETVASPLGVFLVMGLFTLVTALLPGALFPFPPSGGTDLEQLLAPRRVLAHWTHAAALEGIVRGEKLAAVFDRSALEALLPSGGEVEPIELGYALCLLDAGDVTAGEARLRDMAARLHEDAPDWLRCDTMNQLGCLAALRGDVAYAQACLGEVETVQSWPWYSLLLTACLAKARDEDWQAPLATWRAAVDAHETRAFALAGNEWVLRALAA